MQQFDKKGKTVRIAVTTEQFTNAIHSDKFDGKSHRDFIEWLFNGRGYAVTSFIELKYFYFPKFFVVEGDLNKSIISAT